MKIIGKVATFGVALLISTLQANAASAGIWDLFHHHETKCYYCSECGCWHEEEDDDDDDKHDHHCCLGDCLFPPAPPSDIKFAFGVPAQIDSNRPVSNEETAEEKKQQQEKQKKEEAAKESLENRMARLERDLAKLANDIETLATAMKKHKQEGH